MPVQQYELEEVFWLLECMLELADQIVMPIASEERPEGLEDGVLGRRLGGGLVLPRSMSARWRSRSPRFSTPYSFRLFVFSR